MLFRQLNLIGRNPERRKITIAHDDHVAKGYESQPTQKDGFHPAMSRADKYTLAALEATLALYRDPETARREIPTLRMLTEDVGEIRRRGEAIEKGVREKGVGGNDVEKKASVDLIEGFSEVGGGSFPETKLPTWLVRLTAERLTADGLVERLRGGDPPIIARIADGHVVLDPRTILPDQVDAVARGIAVALGG